VGCRAGPLLTANAPHDEDLLGATVSHSALCDLHQHGEQRLLQEDGTHCRLNTREIGRARLHMLSHEERMHPLVTSQVAVSSQMYDG